MENTQVGPFLVIRKVGSRRRHNVYQARQTEQNRDVALKFLRLPNDFDRDTGLAKIYHEAQVIKKLSHDNIVQLFGAGTHEDKVFFAHELVEGESLYALLTRLGRMASDLVIDYGTQLASALDYLHQNDLIHNNLSTDKVMVTAEGSVKLADVRLNRPRRRRWDAPKRATLETAAYMSPEQLLGDGSTAKSDVYSLGVLLYEMVTGKLPFDPKTMGSLARDKQSDNVKQVTDHVMNCPAWLDKLIMQMINADPKSRPHSAKAVQLTLEQIRTVDQSKSSAAAEMTRGFSALSAGKDRAEARKLLGKKSLEEKEKRAGPLTQSMPFLIGGLVMVGLIVTLVVFWPFSGTKADRMAQANDLMRSAAPEDWQEARTLYKKLKRSSDPEIAADAAEKYKLSRRKSMLYRLKRGVTGLDKVEIREFYRGFELQNQHNPEEALIFFKRFVAEYDLENRLDYVYDEAQDRLTRLTNEQKESIEVSDEITAMLDEADELAKSTDTLDSAHEKWNEVLDKYATNDFLRLLIQRAETGKATYPIGMVVEPKEEVGESKEEGMKKPETEDRDTSEIEEPGDGA